MRKSALEQIRKHIVAQADAAGENGWLEIAVPEAMRAGGRLRVPRGAFEQWCVHLNRAGHLVQPWKPVSPVGVKQGADDPYHTDWMLGAGLEPRAMRDDKVNPHWQEFSSAVWQARNEIAERVLGTGCFVLLPGPDVEGAVLKPAAPGKVAWDEAGEQPPVLVLRDASPGWLADVMQALDLGGAVVVERGGEMAHLITEMRSHGRGPIIRVPGARKLYADDAVIHVSTQNNHVRLVEQDRLAVPSAFPASILEEEDEEPVPAQEAAWTPPPGRGGFGLTLQAPGARAENSMTYMEPVYSIKARSHTLHASLQWRGSSSSEHRMLVAYIRAQDGSKSTVTSWARTWRDGEVGKACLEALYLAAPEEHPDSPQTQAARTSYARQEHDWWLRSYAGLDNARLVERARAELRDRAALLAEGPEGLEDGDGEYRDAVHSYWHSFRHFDIEFKARGMQETIFDLDMEEPDADQKQPASAGPAPAPAPAP